MQLPLSFWAKRFALQVIVWMIAVIFMVVVGVGLWYPASRWLFADGWQWASKAMWLKAILGAVPIGVMIGGLFTLYEWLQHTTAQLPKKIVVGIAVALFLVMGVMAKGIDGMHWLIKQWDF